MRLIIRPGHTGHIDLFKHDYSLIGTPTFTRKKWSSRAIITLECLAKVIFAQRMRNSWKDVTYFISFLIKKYTTSVKVPNTFFRYLSINKRKWKKIICAGFPHSFYDPSLATFCLPPLFFIAFRTSASETFQVIHILYIRNVRTKFGRVSRTFVCQKYFFWINLYREIKYFIYCLNWYYAQKITSL